MKGQARYPQMLNTSAYDLELLFLSVKVMNKD